VLLVDQQTFIVAVIGAVELLVEFVLRDDGQQSLRVHSVYVGADVLDVGFDGQLIWALRVGQLFSPEPLRYLYLIGLLLFW
jgi:hypothetical protein